MILIEFLGRKSKHEIFANKDMIGNRPISKFLINLPIRVNDYWIGQTMLK